MVKKKPDNKETSITRSSAAEYLTFITAKGEGGVEAVYADENVWLSQKMMAVLYDAGVLKDLAVGCFDESVEAGFPVLHGHGDLSLCHVLGDI